MKTIDVATICNALVDILVEVDDGFITERKLNKGIMHLTGARDQTTMIQALRSKGKEFAVELGGSSLNCIRALAVLGRRTSFAGMIADDEFGARIAGRLADLQINSHLKYDSGSETATGSCLVLVTPDGERTMNTCLGASAAYGLDIVASDDIEEAKIFHFCGYQWDTDNQRSAIKQALKEAKRAGALISFDLADPFVVEKYREDFLAVIKEYADLVFANQKEAELLLGSTDPEQNCRQISEMSCIAAVKIGAKGALISAPNGGELHRIPAVPTQVVDTTAAGDLFAAGFLYGMTANLGIQDSGLIAVSLAADIISRIGASMDEDSLNAALSRAKVSGQPCVTNPLVKKH